MLPSLKEEPIETDLLIIGGGLSGAFAAIKAKEAGDQVYSRLYELLCL